MTSNERKRSSPISRELWLKENGSLVKQMFLSSPADLYVPCESK